MSAVTSEILDALLDDLADRVAKRLAAASAPNGDVWHDQHSSPLPPRKHMAAARRRIREGAPGAAQQGRRWLLTATAVAEELSRTTATAARAPAPSNAVSVLRSL